MSESLHFSPETITTLFVRRLYLSEYKIKSFLKSVKCCKFEEREFWVKDTKLDSVSLGIKNKDEIKFIKITLGMPHDTYTVFSSV